MGTEDNPNSVVIVCIGCEVSKGQRVLVGGWEVSCDWSSVAGGES